MSGAAWRPNYLLDGVNHMDNVTAFLARWRSGGAAPDPELPLITTAFGNINQTGVAGDYTSPDLARTEARFFDGIEPGVRELVKLVVERFGWTTYTSCQGHTYPGTSILPVERHVGMLPVSDAEYAQVRAVVHTVEATFIKNFGRSPVWPAPYEVMLTSNDGTYPVIDLVFRRAVRVSWDEYFADLEPAYRTTLDILGELLQRRAFLLARAAEAAGA